MISLKRFLSNNVLQFIFSRYLLFGISFLRATVFAYFLGPYFYGILGFVLLFRKYLSFTNVGVPVSLNYYLSISTESEEKDKYFSNALIANGISTLLIFLFICTLYFINFNNEVKGFNVLVFLVSIFSILNNFSLLFNNVFRNIGKIRQVMLYQLVCDSIVFLALFSKSKENIIYFYLIFMIINEIIYLVISIIKSPFKFSKFKVEKQLIKKIFTKGITILMFTSIVSLLFISTRTFISYFYPIKTLGVYTFSESMAVVAITAFDTIIWLLLPKLFYKLRSGIENDEVVRTIKTIRSIYTPILFLVIFILITLFPIILFVFKDYSESYLPFILILIARGLIANGLGYGLLTVTRNLEHKAFIAGLVSIALNSLLCFILVYFRLNFYLISFVMVISSMTYTILVVKIGMQSIRMKTNILSVLNECLPYNLYIPIIICLFINIYYTNFYFLNILVLILFIALNYSDLKLAFIKTINKINNQESFIN